MTKLYLDTETYSETPIRNGGYRYTADAECMIVTYAFDDGPVQVWDATQNPLIPNDLDAALDNPDVVIICHNSQFDRNILRTTLGYIVPIERFRCTMVRAMQHGLPGSLDKLCDIFKLGEQAKHKEGKALILFFCKPNKGVRNTHVSHPEKWQQFIDYARSDITSMRELDRILPKWNITRSELEYWYADQRRNDRGAFIDVGLAEGALRAVDKAQRTLKDRTQELTNYDGLGEGLESTSKRDKMLDYMLEAYGVSLPNLQMATIERRLEDPDLPRELKELLAMRLQVSTTSTSKYKAMLKAVNDDGRVRGLIQFSGAIRTGRDAGRNIQVQNLPSRELLPQDDIDLGVRLLKLDSADLVYDNIMQLTSSCIRSAICAPEGKKLVVADLSNIEGRYIAWAAGETWKLQAFEDFDAGIGPDLYKLAYAKSFKIDPDEVDKHQRSIGKVQELFLSYGGGAGAFFTGAAGYGFDLEELGEIAYPTLPVDIRKEAEGFYDWTVKQRRSTLGMSKQAFTVCDAFKRLWRQAHPMVVALWAGLEHIAVEAIATPSKTFSYGAFKARRDGQWLRIIMPSGRSLCFPYPRINDKGAISFMGVHMYTRKWERLTTWGGKLAENISQAGARDVFKHGELLAEENGYEAVLVVHDEIVSEVPDTEEYTHEGLSSFMATVPDWAEGLPLAAEGFTSYRYRK
ncbi:MAG TPA: DNA polymerase [Mucilaginibacter sp.]|jgi:DNA polymerase